MAISGNAKKRHTPANGTPASGNDDGDLTKSCEKCGASNPLATRFCVACSHPFAGAPAADEKTELFPAGQPATVDANASDAEHQEELRKLREQHAAELAACEEARQQLQAVIDGLRADNALQAVEDNEALAKILEERDRLDVEIGQGKAAAEEHLKALDEAKTKLVEMEAQIQALQAELAAKPAAEEPRQSVADVTLQYELTAAKAHIESLTQERAAAFEEIDRLRGGDLGSAQAEIDRLQGELEAVKAEAEASITTLREAVKSANDWALRISNEKTAVIEEIQGQLADEVQRVTDLTAQLAAAQSSHATGSSSSATQSEVDSLKAELNRANAELSKTLDELSKAQQELASTKAELAKALSDVEAAKARLIEAKRLVDGANDKATKAEAESARLNSIVTNRDGTIASLERRVQELSDKLATASSTAVLDAIPAAMRAELDRTKAELAKALDDKAEFERQRNDAIDARDMAQSNAKNHYENEFLKAEANLKKVYDEAVQATVYRIEAGLQGQIAYLTQERDALLAGRKPQQRKRIGGTVAILAVLATVVMGVMYRGCLLDAVGLGPQPVLIPTTSENLQKFFMQSEPTCIKGKVVAPAKDTLGIVCEKYVVDGDCTDVIGCQIQLPSEYARSGYRQLTSDVLRAFNFSSTDPTCVPEPQLASFQKAREDGLRIDFCNAEQDRNAFTFNAARNCYDYSKLCLVNPTYDTGKTK